MGYSPSDTLQADTDDDSYVYPTQFMFLSPADGAIADPEASSISFPHRDAKYFFAMCGRWRDGYSNSEDTMKTWLMNTMDAVQPYLSEYSFVSFPDWDLENWQTAYYRDTYADLQNIKARYDPAYIFRYSQSIIPAGWPYKFTNDNLKLPFHAEHGEVSRYREWELDQRQLAAEKATAGNVPENSKSVGFNLKNIELWAFIIGGIIVALAAIQFVLKKRSFEKQLKGQYAPLKTQTHTFESADDTENVVAL